MNDPVAQRPWLPYVAPMAIYLLFLQAQVIWPQRLPFWYPAKTVVVAATLWFFRKQYVELCWPFGCRGASVKRRTGADAEPAAHPSLLRTGSAAATAPLWEAVLVGLLAIVIWIAIDPFYPKLGTAALFDPTGRWLFLSFRIAGAVLVVPLMEELFWRAFLIRWLVNRDFQSVPVGTFTGLSFVVTVALFGVEHTQWLAGLVCGVLYNWLYYRWRDLSICVVAHAVSNAALAAWVLATGDWKFW